MARWRTRDSGEGKSTNPCNHTGSPCAGTGKETKNFPYGQSPFLKRVCDHMGSNIYTDASDFQLGACIIQRGRPVAYFSCRLKKSQQNKNEMEKEMLFIVEILIEF